MMSRLIQAPLLLLILLLARPSAAQVESTFDADLDGWTVVGDNAAAWQPIGGNPGGYLEVNDLVTGAVNLAAAPGKFLGDWSTFTSADSVSWDLYFRQTSGTQFTPAYMIRLRGPGGDLRGIVPGVIPPQNVWTTYSVPMDSTAWTVQSGSYAGVMADVQIVELYAEFVSGSEEVRIDNVRLTSTPGDVFTPCALSTFNDGSLESWSFTSSGGVSNPNDQGNSLGYIRITDGTGNTYAYAPARYLGDWSSYDGSGYLTVDVRVISRGTSVNVGSPDFITLSGPGGSAHVSLALEDISAGNRNWTTYEFRIDPTLWTLDSGTWAGLLANVTECRIDVEYFSGTETIGMDNFGRMMDGCPPPDAPVVVHVPDVVLCGTHGLVSAYSAVRNPVDGWIYAVVKETLGAGGGFYAVNGPQAGAAVATFDLPVQAVMDDDGDAFVSFDNTAFIQRIPPGGPASIWANGFHSGDDDLWAMAFAPAGFNGPNVSEGDILVTDRGYSGAVDEIWAFSPDVAEGELQVKPDPGPDADWVGISDGPGGTMWITDLNAPNTIFELKPDGSLVSTAISIQSPRGLVYVAAENVFYVMDGTTQSIYRLDPTTWTETLVASGFRGLSSAGIAVTHDEQRLLVVDSAGDRVYEFCLPVAVAAPEGIRPAELPLMVAPNPFTASTRLQFEIPRRSAVDVTVYDVSGRAVRTLLQGNLPAGPHSVRWDGRGPGGAAATGIYFVRLRTETGRATERMLLLR